MKILVTGGAGFIGSNCCNALARDGHIVVAFDNLSLGTGDALEPGVQLVKGDVRDAAALQALRPVDFVIHLAAASSAKRARKRRLHATPPQTMMRMKSLMTVCPLWRLK